jgi:hypothetical protein
LPKTCGIFCHAIVKQLTLHELVSLTDCHDDSQTILDDGTGAEILATRAWLHEMKNRLFSEQKLIIKRTCESHLGSALNFSGTHQDGSADSDVNTQ